jgi:nicotinamide riboside transporter PnuC
VKVYPGVDYAFIVALIVVLNEEDMVWLSLVKSYLTCTSSYTSIVSGQVVCLVFNACDSCLFAIFLVETQHHGDLNTLLCDSNFCILHMWLYLLMISTRTLRKRESDASSIYKITT